MIRRTMADLKHPARHGLPQPQPSHPPSSPVSSDSTAQPENAAGVFSFPPDRTSDLFDLYEHIPLTPRDVVVFRIMAALTAPKHARRPGQRRGQYWTDAPEKSEEKFVGSDLYLLDKLLYTSFARVEPLTFLGGVLDLVQRYYLELRHPSLWMWIGEIQTTLCSTSPYVMDWDDVQDLYGRLLAQYFTLGWKSSMDESGDWSEHGERRLQALQRQVECLQDGVRLYNGGAAVPLLKQRLDRGIRESSSRGSQTPTSHRFSNPPLLGAGDLPLYFTVRPSSRRRGIIDVEESPLGTFGMRLSCAPSRGRGISGRGGRRRAQSEPDMRSFVAAGLPRDAALMQLEIVYPKLPLSKLFERSRSRSLCRSRIDEMFSKPSASPLWSQKPTGEKPTEHRILYKDRQCIISHHDMRTATNQPTNQPTKPERPHAPCQNCADPCHETWACRSRCGFCGAPNPYVAKWDLHTSPPGEHGNPHIAAQCPVTKSNRCKCVAFPQFHTADRCSIVCSRDCGNRHPRGSQHHLNAMTCKSRCCMCGLRGHSGKRCRLRSCRCKGKHLGQDCCWNPVCRVPGCDRFLCGLHCRECGSSLKPFVNLRCQQCLSGGGRIPASGRVGR